VARGPEDGWSGRIRGLGEDGILVGSRPRMAVYRSSAAPDLPLSLHVAWHFAGNLDSLARLHRSLGWQALALLGREMMRRLT